jgi:hypothetical protein
MIVDSWEERLTCGDYIVPNTSFTTGACTDASTMAKSRIALGGLRMMTAPARGATHSYYYIYYIYYKYFDIYHIYYYISDF